MNQSPSNSSPSNSSPISFTRLIITGILTSFQVTTVRWLFSPFLPVIAAGLGVNVVTLGQIIGLSDLTGLLTPAIGSSADRIGYRITLRFCLLLTAFGALIIGSSTSTRLFIVGIILIGIGSTGFSPVLYAYCSIFLPYERRARGLGMVECSWALTSIIGLPITGIIIEQYGWRVPFLILSATLIVTWIMLGTLPESKSFGSQISPSSKSNPWQNLRIFFQISDNGRSTYSTILARGGLGFAYILWSISYGIWFSTQYNLTPAQLGGVAMVLGCFQSFGNVCVTLFTDRIGKRRSVLIGTIVALIGSIAMPWFDIGIISALIALAVTSTAVEFSMTSTLVLLSQQVPSQPGKVLSLGTSASWIANGLGAIVGPWLYINYSVLGVSIASSVGCGMAVLLLLLWVKETHEPITK